MELSISETATFSPDGALISTAPMIIAGEISYSFYMLQWFSFSMFREHNWLNAGLAFIFATAFAYGSYSLIEVPARRFIRQISTFNFIKKWQKFSNSSVEAT